MTPQSEAHLKRIKEEFCLLVDAKYRRGYDEHHAEEGELEEMPTGQLIEYALAEAIDQITYLLSLREKRRKLQHMVESLDPGSDASSV